MNNWWILIIPAFALIPLGYFLAARVRYGSWVGALLRGQIERELGAIRLLEGTTGSQTMCVYLMSNAASEEPFIGITITSKAPMSVQMQALKLSQAQATELGAILSRGPRS
ncbi:MAG: hypothetical protein SF069_00475 [Phycisphaerae bacterium]|nr:hypothetical protein [Phycisphaerae bacterium]